MANPTDFFFKLGDKVTRGDPMRQQDFTYYMIWILFIAFAAMFISNLISLIRTGEFNFAIWMLIGFAIMSLQYFNLKQIYELRKLRRNPVSQKEEKIESVEEMLESFSNEEKEKKVKGGTNKNVRKEKEKR